MHIDPWKLWLLVNLYWIAPAAAAVIIGLAFWWWKS